MIQRIEALPQLPPRKNDSHKGDYGRVLVVGGSRGMAGAAALAGISALRGGAGLVKLAVSDRCLETVAAHHPCYMTAPLADDASGRIALAALPAIEELAAQSSVVAIGPGIGQSGDLTELVSQLYRRVEAPVVVDADGLNALAASASGLTEPGGTRVLTPHPGEFSRLIGGKPPSREAACQRADELAAAQGIVIVLKGARTWVTDGARAFQNSTGNPGLATGGTGDVLTGLVAALIAQLDDPFEAAALAVHLHGLAGDLAAGDLGEVALTASDLPDYFPAAFKQLAANGGV